LSQFPQLWLQNVSYGDFTQLVCLHACIGYLLQPSFYETVEAHIYMQALLGVPPWIMIKRYHAIAQTDKEL
jgi:hypothetical protein